MISPLYGQLSPLRVPTSMRFISNDADVVAYVLAVEAADGDRLEDGVISAIESFITGCKADGIFSAIKASCILAGARTLDGALVPLVGTSPTNSNFVTADYNRVTGLKGNLSTKRLNANRNNNADPQDSKHLAVFATTFHTRGTTAPARSDIGSSAIPAGNAFLRTLDTRRSSRINYSTSTLYADTDATPGLWAITRVSSSSHYERFNQTNRFFATTSATPVSSDLFVFSGAGNYSDARLSFYSIGESIDLALLDSRVSTLMTDLAAAI
jgi:hypothetical protein